MDIVWAYYKPEYASMHRYVAHAYAAGAKRAICGLAISGGRLTATDAKCKLCERRIKRLRGPHK